MISYVNTKVLTRTMLAAAFVFGAPSSVFAEQANTVDILPPVTHEKAHDATPNSTTHSTIKITPDKSELIHLNQPAGSIIVGNPQHINVIADSAKTLVIVPRTPGATHFTVLGTNGTVIMQRHVIVAAPHEDYMRIKRTCTDDDCAPTSVFYCPEGDMCNQIGLNPQAGDGGQTSASTPASRKGNGGNKDTNAHNDYDDDILLEEEQ